MTPLRLGMIGLSPGNGHPYSWSAVFNGYEPAVMEHCGVPVIPRYLEQQSFPEDAIAEARVTHVWAQDGEIARHVASAARIGHVVTDWRDLIGAVDGILLARDDAESHLEFASPFLEAGLPIYVDKPLALSTREAQQLIDRQQYPGQLYSCSALRYAKEFCLDDAARASIGTIRQIHATVPKDWDKYAVHVIEPLLLLTPDRGPVVRCQRWQSGDANTLQIEFENGIAAQISTLGSSAAPLALRVIGETGWRDLVFKDTFHAFRSALHEFVQGALHRDVRIAPQFMLEVVNVIELGRGQ